MIKLSLIFILILCGIWTAATQIKSDRLRKKTTRAYDLKGYMIEEAYYDSNKAVAKLNLHTNILLFRKKPQRLKPAFAADAAVFDTAEWCSQVA